MAWKVNTTSKNKCECYTRQGNSRVTTIKGGVFKRFFYFFPDADYTHKVYLRNVKRLFGLVLEEYAHMAIVADSAIGVHLIITRFIRRH